MNRSRAAVATVVAVAFLCGVAVPQPRSSLEQRVRELEMWQQAHDRDVPKGSAVYVERIEELQRRLAELEQARTADMRWFFAGVGTLLLASLAYLLKRMIEEKNGGPGNA